VRISSLPVISISASVLKSEQQEAYDIGADNVIGKPFDPIKLYAMIITVLEEKKGNKVQIIDN